MAPIQLNHFQAHDLGSKLLNFNTDIYRGYPKMLSYDQQFLHSSTGTTMVSFAVSRSNWTAFLHSASMSVVQFSA
jgi:hypothetical protein